MDYEVYVTNSENGIVFDISTLCTEIEHETYLSGQAGKLTLTVQKDPNGVLTLSNGSIISFLVDKKGVFYGYIFTMSTTQNEVYKITAYDQLRYLKNEEVYVTKDMTATQIFNKICQEAGLQFTSKVETSYVCPVFLHDKKSRYAIIEYGLNQTLINEGLYCFIKDDYGTLTLSELEQEKTDLIIGEKSLLTTYQYEISIDKDTFNEVKIVRDNEETGKRDVWIAHDSTTQAIWGSLRLLEKADKDANESEIANKAERLLKLKNRETKTIKLTALGDCRLNAGSGFILNLDSLKINEYMWIIRATHTYKTDSHVMQLEVFI